MKIFVATKKAARVVLPVAEVSIGKIDISTNSFLEGMSNLKTNPDFDFFRVTSSNLGRVLFTNSDTNLATGIDYAIVAADGNQIIAVPKNINFVSVVGHTANQDFSIQQGEYVEV